MDSRSSETFLILGRRIKAERQARHLTQQELAAAAAMDTAHLSRIEHGTGIPSINVVKKLADALGLPIGKLFSDVPVRSLPDHGWAGKMGALVGEMTPRQRAKVLRVLKSLVRDD